MGENKIESFKQYGDASGISSHYLFKRLKLHSVRNMLCTCIVWCDETAMMIEYCAKMIGAIGVETGEEKRMKIIDKYFIKICNHNFECGCLFHGYDTYNINIRNISIENIKLLDLQLYLSYTNESYKLEGS